MGLLKKVKKFFKKLGKQIKTNLKHGAKYIAPVLISAMTGGFGSGIVKSLFGNKLAGNLAKLGNNTIGKLFGGRASTAALPGAAEGAEAVADTVGLAAEPTLGGSLGISNVVQNALSPVLSNAANMLPGASNAVSLVASSPVLGALDKGLGTIISNAALNNATGKLARTYGTDTANAGNTGNTGNSASTAKIEFLNKAKPDELGDGAKAIDVDPDNSPDVTAISPINRDEFRKDLKAYLNTDEEDDERFKTNNFSRFSRRFA